MLRHAFTSLVESFARRRVLLSVACAAIISTGCDKKAQTRSEAASDRHAPPAEGPAMHRVEIKVSARGEIRADGVLTTVEQIDSRLATLASENGVVWYFREASASEPHPNASQVIELILKHRLVISMSSKPDFSDYIDANGVSRPRK